MACLRKILQQMKQRMDKKVSCVSKEIAAEIADHEAHKELSKGREMDTHSDVLLKASFQELILISSNQINWKLDNNIYSVILIDSGVVNSSDI